MKSHTLPGYPPVPKNASKTSVPAVKPRRFLKALAVAAVTLILLLVAARICLPYWAEDYVNGRIVALNGYSGSVGDIDIALWRGAYQLHHIDIRKTDGKAQEPFVAADTIDLSVQWDALLHGRILAKAAIRDIALTFSKNQNGRGPDWTGFIDSLSPFDINQTTIDGGRVAYVDHTVSPGVNLYINDIRAEVTNLRNAEERPGALPSALHVQGRSIGRGALTIYGRGNIMKDIPDFALNIKLENASLSAFNNYTRHAVFIDFNGGKISIYSELAALNGHVTGYIKPIATDVDMLSLKDARNPLGFAWETLAAAFMEIFKNHAADQFALRIPVAGNINNPDKDVWSAFLSIFENAFGKAFPRATDGTLDWKYALKTYGLKQEAKPKE